MNVRAITLLLAATSTTAAAAPWANWIEVYHAEMDAEWPDETLRNAEGTEQGVSIAFATSAQGYFRADLRREQFEWSPEALGPGDRLGPGLVITDDAIIDPALRTFEDAREMQALSVGIVSPWTRGLDLIGEIGVAEVETQVDALNAVISGGDVTQLWKSTETRSERGAIVRLGLIADDEAITWGGTMEWLSKVPMREGGTDSAKWWNAHIGWQMTPNWNVSVRYADNEEYTSKGVSLRFTY